MKSIKRQDFLNVANQYNDYIGKVKKEGFFTYFTLYNHDESDFIDIEYNLLRHYILVSHETDYKLYNINDLPIFIDNFLKKWYQLKAIKKGFEALFNSLNGLILNELKSASKTLKKTIGGYKMKTASNIVSRLDSLISLKEQVKVYVPSTFDIDQKIDNSFFVNEVQKRLSNLFGGATSYKADGSWITSDNVLVNENITVIVAFTSQLDNIAKDEVLTICEWLKNELKQEAVSMELNNELYFV